MPANTQLGSSMQYLKGIVHKKNENAFIINIVLYKNSMTYFLH